jgi:ATP-binding cassette subfamily B protein
MRMRKVLFPVSWLIQSRLAEVATVVDENVNGVRVVKSFAAEEQQLRQLAGAADRVQWGYIKDADLRARFSPLIQNLSQVGLVLVLVFGGYMVIHGTLGYGAILAFNAYLLMMQAPFMMLGHADHDGPACLRLGRAYLRDPRRAGHHRRSSRCRRPDRQPG